MESKMDIKKYVNLFSVIILLLLMSACNKSFDEKPHEEKITDLDLITADGHPTYYGKMADAQAAWGEAEKGKIIFPDSHDKYSEKTIMILDGNSKEETEIIRGIEIYFENFSNSQTISLEEAIDIAASYIPHEIINRWYEFDQSYCLQSIEYDNKKDTYYVISYGLTEEGSEAYYKKRHSYSGSIDIVFEKNKEGYINYLAIKFGTPRWMSSIETNGYKKVEWDYNF